MTGSLEAVESALERWRGEGPFVLGMCGAQGSGKSTLAGAMARRLDQRGLRSAVLSLDDLYLPHEARARLARETHPLFATRGVPGTHDVEAGSRILDAARAGRDFVLPRFDKATDDPAPREDWLTVSGPVDVLIFEGWCVGARPQAETDLIRPVNALEADRDADGLWRRRVNAALAGPYAELFARIDRLVLLAAPGFEVVARWRTEQERALRLRVTEQGGDLDRLMSDAQVASFIQHYERLTRWILRDMPLHADMTLNLDEQRRLKRKP